MKVSISQIKQFKACRRAWYLHYVENLEPVAKSDALTVGTNYHALLETLYKDGKLEDVEPTKEAAMAKAYEKYIFPAVKVELAEEWLERKITPEVTLIGRVDGMTADGVVVEHKTTSRDIGAEYEYNLMWDEQVLAYMYLTGTRRIIYTVVKKPTIRLKKDETPEEFYKRMLAWYDEDTESKIRTFNVIRTDEEVQAFVDEFVDTVAQMDGKHCYRNTLHCSNFGSDCPYRSVCLHYDKSQEYIEFTRREEHGTYKD
jgi:hypothetical protein